MTLNHRQQEIVALASTGEQILVRDLAARFTVSEMTIRRDLHTLDLQGLLVRTHGGASLHGGNRLRRSSFSVTLASPQKMAIGRLAAELVAPGQTVMFDAGTTALEVARRLPRMAGLTVATTSLCVAQELFGSPINVVLLGGMLRQDFPCLYGPMTEKMLKSLHVDLLFIGCDGAQSDDGFYTADVHLSHLEQEMMRVADRVVVVTESGKFGQRAFVRYAAVDEIDTVVTDDGLAEADRRNLEDRGVAILLAQTQEYDEAGIK